MALRLAFIREFPTSLLAISVEQSLKYSLMLLLMHQTRFLVVLLILANIGVKVASLMTFQSNGGSRGATLGGSTGWTMPGGLGPVTGLGSAGSTPAGPQPTGSYQGALPPSQPTAHGIPLADTTNITKGAYSFAAEDDDEEEDQEATNRETRQQQQKPAGSGYQAV